MPDIRPFLIAIEKAATSTYALGAYLISAILFLYSIHKQSNLVELLKKIESLPENDRRPAIEAAMNAKVPERIDAKDWIRHQRLNTKLVMVLAGILAVTVVVVVAIQEIAAKPTPSSAVTPKSPKISLKAQLWPDPRNDKKFPQKFLAEHDARLYVKIGQQSLDFANFVATPDYLEEDLEIEDTLLNKPAELLVSPRTKYRVEDDKRLLSQLLRVEVFPLMRKPIRKLTQKRGSSGQVVLATTGLPLFKEAAPINLNFNSSTSWVVAGGKIYLLNLQGDGLSTSTRVQILNTKGERIVGSWAGNELGTTNGKPVEVSGDGSSLKIYFQVPPAAQGQTINLQVSRPPDHWLAFTGKVAKDGAQF